MDKIHQKVHETCPQQKGENRNTSAVFPTTAVEPKSNKLVFSGHPISQSSTLGIRGHPFTSATPEPSTLPFQSACIQPISGTVPVSGTEPVSAMEEHYLLNFQKKGNCR
jgi:hypothetical protein